MRKDELDYLTEKLKDLFGRRSINAALTKQIYNKMSNEEESHIISDFCNKTIMTEPYESDLKKGKVEYVNNFRYLEFLRDEDRPLVFEEYNNNKFVIAIGKNTKETIQPDWAEIYVFNVNEKDDQRILNLCDDLEQFMVAILAERFKVPDNWKGDIINGLNNLKTKLLGQIEDEKQLDDALGTYAGEVYTTMSCKGYTNFPMKEEDIRIYINKVIVQSNKAITDKNVYFTINNNFFIKKALLNISKNVNKDLKYRLDLLKENLKKLKLVDTLNDFSDHKRPLYLLNAFEDGFNCELLVSLTLYLITCNRSLFSEITEADVCCLPPEFLKEHAIYVADPHMILIFNINERESFIFDPADVINLTGSKEIEFVENIYDDELYKTYKILDMEGDFAGLTQLQDELISEFNVTSEYCVISKLKHLQTIRRLEDYIGGFVLIIEKKVDAGLPYESLLDTIRRLLILLSRNPSIDKILILKDRSDDVANVKRLFYSLLSNLEEIPSEKWDRIYLWTRMSDYGIEREMINEILSKIVVYPIDYEDLNFKKLESILARDVSQATKLKIPNRSKSFELYPSRDIAFEFKNATEFDKINDLFYYAENNLIRFGEIGKDRDDLERIQLKREFSVKIIDYSDLNDFMEDRGIKNAYELYNLYVCSGGIFADRIHGAEEYKRYEHFLMELSDAIKNERLCYSNILSLTTKKEDGRYNKTQIGWETITPYLSKDRTNSITISFTHTLRSVDLYDGFPFNLFFCIELSKEIKDGCEKIAGVPIKLKEINLVIRHLHAYLDSIPFKIIEMKEVVSS